MINSEKKEKYFSRARIDIVGSEADTNTNIYQFENDDIMIREVNIKSKKGGEPVQILQMTDLHLNRMNERDYLENDPVLMSTRQYRMAFRNESTVQNVKKSVEIIPFFDLTVVTGDVMDYLTWGSLDLIDELIWNDYPEVLIPLGGHDYTREMEGVIQETPAVLEANLALLKTRWKHDLFYTSDVLSDKVMVITMFNDCGYREDQIPKLKEDLIKAKNEDLIVLIFQHEPICTRNPEEKEVHAIRSNDKNSAKLNFCDNFSGCEKSNEITKAMYKLITENADIIKGVFCGHEHNDFYTEIKAYSSNGESRTEAVIPQYVLTGNMYDEGHVRIITVE